MLNIKFVGDINNTPELKVIADEFRAADKALVDQHNWLADKAVAIDKQRKEGANKFWGELVEEFKKQGKLPKEFELFGPIMITFGYDGSDEVFTMTRPQQLG